MNYDAYALAISEQVTQHIAALDELQLKAQTRPLDFIERNSVERSLQVIVEAAIVCAKHFLKSRKKPVPAEARAAIERVYEMLALTEPAVQEMRGAIGMRNAIIHDYLNLDWAYIDKVLLGRKYLNVRAFVKVILKQLKS
ncbi:DUF86 domain-containing protein [Simiduia curdlanivorans]|uniref:DUF86 domain-containing protein n=1 Tax=Simiduia curdlanivorans TaxID=1492769 RepID=A0ABV8V1K8_9GAMM|nr:DUF86 domain-containing protein [Simiduia curdlanivorans]MDN3639997.1 DUF86 domain-containing protein [Simiduia curdlanivorans]